jgi:hypothetical protein
MRQVMNATIDPLFLSVITVIVAFLLLFTFSILRCAKQEPPKWDKVNGEQEKEKK